MSDTNKPPETIGNVRTTVLPEGAEKKPGELGPLAGSDSPPKKRWRIEIVVEGHTREEAYAYLRDRLTRAKHDGAWNSIGGDGWIATTEDESAPDEKERRRLLSEWCERDRAEASVRRNRELTNPNAE